MSYQHKNNIFRSLFYSRGMVVFILFAIVFVSLGLFTLIGKSMDASKARKISEKEASVLKVKENDLTSKITSLQTPEGEEAALREKYPVVKEGEHVVVITDNSDSNDLVSNSAKPDQGGFWNFLKNLFKSNK